MKLENHFPDIIHSFQMMLEVFVGLRTRIPLEMRQSTT